MVLGPLGPKPDGDWWGFFTGTFLPILISESAVETVGAMLEDESGGERDGEIY